MTTALKTTLKTKKDRRKKFRRKNFGGKKLRQTFPNFGGKNFGEYFWDLYGLWFFKKMKNVKIHGETTGSMSEKKLNILSSEKK